ncbi:MAG: glycosyltransferase [Candidatus Bathyarchaeota archaeon]
MTLAVEESNKEPKTVEVEDSTQRKESLQATSIYRRITVSKKAWVVRVIMLVIMIVIVSYNILQCLASNDAFLVYSSLTSAHTILIFAFSWFLFKSKSEEAIPNDLVSVIIPIYNQKKMIEDVIAAVCASSYQDIEVVAVDDGSTDGTKEVLDGLLKKYRKLVVIHKSNGGKRRAVATGFYASKADYVVLVDSDSIVDQYAIEEIMKAFKANPTVGGISGYGKVLNADDNIFTKLQDAWYDYAFNLHKTFESIFGCVLCCSGCLAAYRREAIARYIPYWSESKIQYSDDRALTTYTIATPWARKEFTPISQKLLESMSQYDDAEDRSLTAQTITQWDTVYIPTAVVQTEVPNTLGKYIRQQIRWKKGYIRSNFFVSAFFWRRNPLMSLIFYTELMMTFTAPLIIFTMYFYAPFILNRYWLALSYIAGQLFIGLVAGLDYRFRCRSAKYWMYKPLMNLFSSVVMSWTLIPALATLKKNQWLTR